MADLRRSIYDSYRIQHSIPVEESDSENNDNSENENNEESDIENNGDSEDRNNNEIGDTNENESTQQHISNLTRISNLSERNEQISNRFRELINNNPNITHRRNYYSLPTIRRTYRSRFYNELANQI